MRQEIKINIVNNKYSIIDTRGKTIVDDLIFAKQVERKNDCPIIYFINNIKEFSAINILGFYYDKYHYTDYKFVSQIVPKKQIFKVLEKGNDKRFRLMIDDKFKAGIFEEIISLESNNYSNRQIIKLKFNNKFFLIDLKEDNKKSHFYDFIFTPIQPTKWFMVLKRGKFGFIDSSNFEEITSISYDSIDDLCRKKGCDKSKYTYDLYKTTETLNFKKVNESPYKSYFIDKSKISKVRWDEITTITYYPNYDTVYNYHVYLSLYRKQIPINQFGYFYNLFDSRKYDVVIHQIDNYFLINKNSKYGLIDSEFNILLDLKYSNIELAHLNNIHNIPLFIVHYYKKGYHYFLFNPKTSLKTKEYDGIYDGISNDFVCNVHFDDSFAFQENGKYGLLSPTGEIIAEAKYSLSKHINSIKTSNPKVLYFQEIFHNKEYWFYINNNSCYYDTTISINEYDSCIRMGESKFKCFYIVRKNNKYGLLNSKGIEIIQPIYDDIIHSNNDSTSFFDNRIDWEYDCDQLHYIITRNENKYYLLYFKSIFYSDKCNIILSECDNIEIVLERPNHYSGNRYTKKYIQYIKNGNVGYINEFGVFFNSDEYSTIEPVICKNVSTLTYYLLKKNSMYGLTDENFKILLPCKFESIDNISTTEANVVENGTSKVINYHFQLTQNEHLEERSDPTYEQYNGTYAQDYMGYSDEDIDTIFDGDPDAYWNID